MSRTAMYKAVNMKNEHAAVPQEVFSSSNISLHRQPANAHGEHVSQAAEEI
jgi:hypothetical protein